MVEAVASDQWRQGSNRGEMDIYYGLKLNKDII